ncbi:MAG TPA: DUF1345 domain-containing protein [Roseiflexaceae bacterium]|nr:DUF1345 domain-containing protein [Roseiflexaceae bacterium]
MNGESHPSGNPSHPLQPRRLPSVVPALLAMLAIGGIYLLVSTSLSPGPPGLILVVVSLLLIPLIVTRWRGLLHLTRMLSFLILGVVTLAEIISVVFLLTQLLAGRTRAPALLGDAALIWVANILTFALWYWEIDGGGPGKRHRDGYASSDLAFPQVALGKATNPPWFPSFIDYLFLAFNTSTAFSPTDTLVLSRRAKILMMLQAVLSLLVLAVLAARAVNTL